MGPRDDPTIDDVLHHGEMSSAPESLVQAATEARAHAHCPYSGYHVGAAIRTVSGAVITGCNVENAAYPLGTCAEAGAISAMVLAGHHEIAELVVVGPERLLDRERKS